jgi:hypothetical protein
MVGNSRSLVVADGRGAIVGFGGVNAMSVSSVWFSQSVSQRSDVRVLEGESEGCLLQWLLGSADRLSCLNSRLTHLVNHQFSSTVRSESPRLSILLVFHSDSQEGAADLLKRPANINYLATQGGWWKDSFSRSFKAISDKRT